MTVLMALCAFAEKGALIISSPLELQLFAVSPNGKWACGVIGDGQTTTLQGMLLNVETGEFTYLSTVDKSSANDVTDDGMVVGSYTDYEVTGTGIGAQVAGYYKDGKWHRLDNSTVEGALSIGAEVYSVSSDGRTMVGYVMDGPKDSDVAPAMWVDGKLTAILPHVGAGVAYTVSEDGKMAAGWAYKEGDNNRNIALWQTPETVEYLSAYSSHAEAGRKFSPNGKLLVCECFGHKFVYNLETKTKTQLPMLTGEACWNQKMLFVDDNGLVLGSEEMQDPSTGRSDFFGYVYDGEKAMRFDTWLKETHNAVVDPTQHMVTSAVDMSADGKVIVLNDYPLQDGSMVGVWASVVVVLDQDITYSKPVALKAEKLRGVNSVRLTWNEPLMNATNVLGYNIYRGETLICEGTTDMAYIDAGLAEGSYSYTVTAIYEDENGELVNSEPSVAAVVDVVADIPNAVFNIQSHAVNYNDLKLRWNAPESNLPSASYFDAKQSVAGFGGGAISFSVAIRLPYDIVASYAGQYSIARVSFMPRNTEAEYTVKVYVNGVEATSQQVDKTTLRYGDMNIIDLDAPVKVAANDDVLVAIDVDASKFTIPSNDVVGCNYGGVVTGFSDLLRQASETEYYSLNQMSLDKGMGEMPMAWAISAIFAPIDADGKMNIACDEVTSYDVYCNDEKLGNTTTTDFFDKGLNEGTHSYGIVANYADGSASNPAPYVINYTPNEEALLAVDKVKVSADVDFVTASWDAPLNNDTRVITYAKGTSSGKGIIRTGASELLEYTVAHEYTYSFLEWYAGYNIEALRFYPTQEAIFVAVLEEDGIDLAFIEIGEMGAEDGYMLNRWNSIKLDEPVKIKAGSTYRVKFVCSEVDPSTSPICMDNGVGEIGVTDLYSWDYSSYSSAISDGGLTGSWMIGMTISNDNTEALPVNSYKVIIDGDSDNADSVTETSYRKDGLNWTDGETHRLKVNTVYDVVGGTLEVEGTQQIFNVTAGVESIEVNRVSVYPNPATSYIKVEGAAEKLVLVDMTGRAVAETANATIDVTALPVGNYLLNIYNNGSISTVKVMIVR